MSNIFSKLRDFINPDEPVDYEYDYDDMEGNSPAYQPLYPSQSNASAPNTDVSSAGTRLRDRSPLSSSAGLTSPPPQRGSSMNSGMNNVIGLPGAANGISEVVVMEPRTFEEMPQAIQALRERKSVVLNLTVMDPDQAQRAVDFIAGGTFALDGHQERIGESIFLFTPSCVQVSTQSGVVRDVMQPHLQAPGSSNTAQGSASGSTPSWVPDFGRVAQS
ncbi:cell division protein SepF [Geitlerinema sp. P-1104]|uniref:cell division protein SepF n=1 Tax=Geitlerinema sp. P-1104 TaxID=2546230 RepID=UPI00147712E7|nr:cell division protein SepF [Geitlerinema sp. P-1104]NMG59124.1 cell division protein SepF [Geitlerinema sp. P-1104]